MNKNKIFKSKQKTVDLTSVYGFWITEETEIIYNSKWCNPFVKPDKIKNKKYKMGILDRVFSLDSETDYQMLKNAYEEHYSC